MLIGNIDFYRFILLSLTLTLPEGHKVTTNPGILASFSPYTFHLKRMKCDVVMKWFKLNILRLLLSKNYGNKIGMHSDVYDRYYCTLHFDTGLIDLVQLSQSQSARNQKLLNLVLTKFSIDLNGIWDTIEICWCDDPHTHFILSVQYPRERTYVCDFVQKMFNISL